MRFFRFLEVRFFHFFMIFVEIILIFSVFYDFLNDFLFFAILRKNVEWMEKEIVIGKF